MLFSFDLYVVNHKHQRRLHKSQWHIPGNENNLELCDV